MCADVDIYLLHLYTLINLHFSDSPTVGTV